MSHFRFDPTIDFVTARAYVPDHGMLPAFAGDSSYVEQARSKRIFELCECPACWCPHRALRRTKQTSRVLLLDPHPQAAATR